MMNNAQWENYQREMSIRKKLEKKWGKLVGTWENSSGK